MYVYENSPAGVVNLKRSDRITAINGIPSSNLISNNGLYPILAELELGSALTLSVLDQNGMIFEYTLEKSLVTMNTILTSEVVATRNQSIGYIAISSFINATSADFSAAVDQVAKEGIDELVFDLRYNLGGRLVSSRDVASLIGGRNTYGSDYAKTIHKDKYQGANSAFPFESFINALDLERVYVLTTESTCSASEPEPIDKTECTAKFPVEQC